MGQKRVSRGVSHRCRRHRAGGGTCPTPKKKENSGSRGTAAQQNLWGTAPATVRSVPKFLGPQHTPTWYEIGATKFCKGQVGLTVYRIHHAPRHSEGPNGTKIVIIISVYLCQCQVGIYLGPYNMCQMSTFSTVVCPAVPPELEGYTTQISGAR